jgi:hypothetical protein
MEATILSWRMQNIFTIMVMILIIGLAVCLAGQAWQYISPSSKGDS